MAAAVTGSALGATLTRVGSWPGVPRLEPKGVRLNGDHLWVGLFDGLTVLDVSEPARPVRGGTITFTQGGAADIYIAGDRAYTSYGPQALRVIDVTDPLNPALVASLTPDRYASTVYARSNFLYTSHNLYGLGVSSLAGSGDIPFGVRLTSVPASGRPQVEGQRFYVPSMHGLEILSYASPTQLTPLGSYETGCQASAVEVVGDLAYLAATNGLHVLDIRDPAHVQEVGVYLCANPIGVRVIGTLACLACEATVFRIVNVADPAHPTLAGSYTNAPARITSFDADATHAYLVASGLNVSLDIVAITNPAAPVLVARVSGANSTVQVRLVQDRAYLAEKSGGLQIVGVQDRANPVLLGSYTNQSNVELVDGTSALACLGDWSGLTVVDTSDPAHPALRGSLPIMFVVQIRCAGDRAYVLSGSGPMTELVIVSLADPAHPARLGARPLGWDTWGLGATTNGYAAVALGAQGLDVIDARQPTSPQRATNYTATSAVWGVDLQSAPDGLRGFLATDNGLEIVDFRPPETPARVGAWTLDGAGASLVRAVGSRCYLASASRLWVLDVANPTQPTLAAQTPGSFEGLDGDGEHVFTACALDGLIIWKVEDQNPVPLLECSPCPIGLRLDWIRAGTNWTLQWSPELAVAQDWQPVAGSQTVTAWETPVTNPAAFFRLWRKP